MDLKKAPPQVPSNPMCQAAYAHAAQELHPSILSHGLRTYLHATEISKQENLAWHLTDSSRLSSLLFVACIFHDIGTSPTYNTGPTRFEIEGADAAVQFLKNYADVTAAKRHDIWVAIAIHDTPQIAERIGVLARLVRLAVMIDFKVSGAKGLVSDEWIEKVEVDLPRGEIEKVLGDVVVEQALKQPGKAPPACWPGALLRAKLEHPDWEGVNKAF